MNPEFLSNDFGAVHKPSPPLSPTSTAIKNGDPVATKEMVISVMKEVNASLGIDLGIVDIAEVITVDTLDGSADDTANTSLDSDEAAESKSKRGRENGKSEFTHAHLVCEACGHIVVAVAQAVIQAVMESRLDGDGSKPAPPPKKKRGGILGFKELAAKAKLSPWHFHRVFRSVTDVTPKAYGEASWEHLMRRYGFDVETSNASPGVTKADTYPDSFISPASNSPTVVNGHGLTANGLQLISPGSEASSIGSHIPPKTPLSSGSSSTTTSAVRTSGPGRVAKSTARSTSRTRSRSRTRPHSQTQQQVLSTLSSIQNVRSRDRNGSELDGINLGGVTGLTPANPALQHMGGINPLGSPSLSSPTVGMPSLNGNGHFDGGAPMPPQGFYPKVEDPLIDSIPPELGLGVSGPQFYGGGRDPTFSGAMNGGFTPQVGVVSQPIPEIPGAPFEHEPVYPGSGMPPVGSYDRAIKPHAISHHRTLSQHAVSDPHKDLSGSFYNTSPPLEMPDLNNLTLQKIPGNPTEEWVVPDGTDPLAGLGLDAVVDPLGLEPLTTAPNLDLADTGSSGLELNGMPSEGLPLDIDALAPMDALSNLPQTFYMTEEQKTNYEFDLYGGANPSIDGHIPFPEGLEEPPITLTPGIEQYGNEHIVTPQSMNF